jgi:tRNA (cmo5U34)-methyltransferase
MDDKTENRWDETLSEEFIDYGRYFVPEREGQIEVIVELLANLDESTKVVELCCGEGLLAEAILDRWAGSTLIGYDGSQAMLTQAGKRLKRFGDRFQLDIFDLADEDWRVPDQSIQAVVTSLAVHHLTAEEKRILFSDVYKMLAKDGVFIIADVINPRHPQSKALAASEYDRIVKQRSIALDGDTRAFEFFQREGWNFFHYLPPDDIDKPSPLFDQLKWLEGAGFKHIDVFWAQAGHAIFGGWK